MKKWISDLSDKARRWAFPGYYVHAPLVSKPEIDVDEEVPRYPPYEKGLPVYSTERLMRRQPEMLVKIRQTFSFPDEDYDRIILPMIERFAAYIHLLPSSEHHHHKGAGGAFRHGLEVAFSAGRSSGAHIFMPEGTPLERKRVEIRWQAAIFFAGLLHDVGKPITDVEVVNADGSLMWSPYSETISEWANKHGIERYFLRWKRNRGNEHRVLGGSIAQRLIPKEVIHWLNEGGTEINQTLQLYLSGSERLKHLLADLVTKADAASVERDLIATGHGKVRDPGFGVPVEQFVLDAMRRLLADGTWKINEPGARVWVVSDGISDGVFVVWKRAVEEIIELLQNDRIQGIPRNPDTLADIMVERDLAVSKKLGNQVFRYWPVCPDVLTTNGQPVRLLMLRLQAPSLLFSEPPPYVGAQIDPPPPQPQPHPTVPVGPSVNSSTGAAPPSPALATPAVPPQHSVPTPPSPVSPAIGNATTLAGAHPSAAVPAVSVVQPIQGHSHIPSGAVVSKPNLAAGAQSGKPKAPAVTVSKPSAGGLTKSTPIAAAGKEPVQSVNRNPRQDDEFWHVDDDDRVGNDDVAQPTSSATATVVAAVAPPPASTEPAASTPKAQAAVTKARNELVGHGKAGRLLVAMAEDIAAGRSNWGERIVQVDGHLLARLPEGFMPYLRFELSADEPDAQPVELACLLRDAGWVVKEHPDAATSMRVIAGIRGVVIRTDIAALVEVVAGDGSCPSTTERRIEAPPRATQQGCKRDQSVPRPARVTAGPTNEGKVRKSANDLERNNEVPTEKNTGSEPRTPEAEDQTVSAASYLLAWARSDPCPSGVKDHGAFREVPMDVVSAVARKHNVGTWHLHKALGALKGVQLTDDVYMITAQETNGG
ncbi:hypothetical protein FHW79_006305 [Azospirillum sp. OGB3]|uniref:MobH family relaxase n=1 Tax=Azospirillum sp. OGB3 TaxID=2587012 RepID=UPI001605AF45|nr:MobH family relaxase [Azospirillum sp. OGB3]MBB3268630.1 hypothetical protein [Azospirillum sp. OGB3]